MSKYEAYYKELRRSVEKRDQEKKAIGAAPERVEKGSDQPDPHPVSPQPPPPGPPGSAPLPPRPLSTPASPGGPGLSSVPATSIGLGLTSATLVRHKNPTTSTLEASLQRSAALEKKDRRR